LSGFEQPPLRFGGAPGKTAYPDHGNIVLSFVGNSTLRQLAAGFPAELVLAMP
jgi:hypothetical protein